MKENKKLLILTASLLGGLAVAGGAAGATYAYFSANAKTHVHVKAGSLALKFERIGISGLVPSNGELVEKTADPTLDYLDLTSSGQTAYSVETAMPGVEITVTFKITNIATTAFSYEASFINLTLGGGDIAEASTELSKALSIAVAPEGSNPYVFSAKDMPKSFPMSSKLGVGESHTFGVTISIATEVGNEIELGSLDYDLQVNAIQYH